ncbi:MAG: PKD domain-containing protein [Thermoplasmata archaeon]|nr:PKD domain-containing protein [Thermoplasmata archaeon]
MPSLFLAAVTLLGAAPLTTIGNSTGHGTPAGTSAGAHCSKPASVLMPLAGPSGSLASGSTLSFTYEFEIVHYSPSDGRLAVYLPRLFATFPLAGGTTFALSVAPQQLTVADGNWTAAPAGTSSRTLNSTTTFATGGTAHLSSELLAVMATTTQFEGLNLSFRWHWVSTTVAGSSVSPWSVNTVDQNCPSDFWPAPYVDLVQDWNLKGPTGSTFTAALTGFTSHQYIFLELETPTGTVVYSHGQTTPAGNTTAHNVTIAYDCWCGRLSPGQYLVHIHNLMGSLLYSVSVTVTARNGLTVSTSAQPLSGPAPLTVSFGSQVTSGAPPYVYAWTFGDGGTSPAADPSHTYLVGGSFAVQLSVTDSTGATASARSTVTVEGTGTGLSLHVSSNVSTGPAPLWVALSVTASGGTPPYVYNWDTGDGGRSSGATVSHLYVRPGNFTATVTARDSGGTTASHTLVISVTSGLEVRLSSTPTSPQPGDHVTITAAVAGNVSIVAYRWTIDRHLANDTGATLGLGPLPAGSYDIGLSVRDRSGAEGNGSLTLVVANASASGSPMVEAVIGAVPPWGWIPIGAGVVAAVFGLAVARRRRPPTPPPTIAGPRSTTNPAT